MRDFLRYLFKPSFWTMLYGYNKIWDKDVNQLIDENKDVVVYYNLLTDSCTHCEIDGTYIWIENYPYGYGTGRFESWGRPSRRTIERLHKYLKPHIEKKLSEVNYSFLNKKITS